MLLPKKQHSWLHPLWWFWLPMGVALAYAAADPFVDSAILYAENSWTEIPHFLVSSLAAVVSFLCLRRAWGGNHWLVLWTFLPMVGSTYIFLEEISYGQTFFHWNTPEYWAQINDQEETNLHNVSSWLDQKPKVLLQIGIAVGGIVIPLLRRFRPRLLPDKFRIIYPDDVMVWMAGLTMFTIIAKKLHKAGILTIYTRASEVTELYIYWFILLYMILLLPKLGKAKKG